MWQEELDALNALLISKEILEKYSISYQFLTPPDEKSRPDYLVFFGSEFLD
jgi:hypothetical protein